MAIINTCGILLIDKFNKILIAHPTNASWKTWSVPKGKMDKGETYLQTAKREFLEESGIDIDTLKGKWYELGMEVYSTKRKQIYGFALKLDHEVTQEPFCASMVENSNPPFPECDAYKWVNFEDFIKLTHHTQVNLLKTYLDTTGEIVYD